MALSSHEDMETPLGRESALPWPAGLAAAWGAFLPPAQRLADWADYLCTPEDELRGRVTMDPWMVSPFLKRQGDCQIIQPGTRVVHTSFTRLSVRLWDATAAPASLICVISHGGEQHTLNLVDKEYTLLMPLDPRSILSCELYNTAAPSVAYPPIEIDVAKMIIDNENRLDGLLTFSDVSVRCTVTLADDASEEGEATAPPVLASPAVETLYLTAGEIVDSLTGSVNNSIRFLQCLNPLTDEKLHEEEVLSVRSRVSLQVPLDCQHIVVRFFDEGRAVLYTAKLTTGTLNETQLVSLCTDGKLTRFMFHAVLDEEWEAFEEDEDFVRQTVRNVIALVNGEPCHHHKRSGNVTTSSTTATTSRPASDHHSFRRPLHEDILQPGGGEGDSDSDDDDGTLSNAELRRAERNRRRNRKRRLRRKASKAAARQRSSCY